MNKFNKTVAGLALAGAITLGGVVTPAMAAPVSTSVSASSVVTPQLKVTAGSHLAGGMRCHWVINWFGLFNGTANKQWVLRCYYGE